MLRPDSRPDRPRRGAFPDSARLDEPHPPIYASATLTPESFVWTANQGFHLATACFVPNKQGVRAGIELYRKTLAEAGHDPSRREVAGVFQMYCGETHREAHAVAGRNVIRYLDFFGSIDAKSPHRSKAYAHHQGGLAHERVVESLTRFAQEVIPRVG